jgi:hypothetical protein
MALRLFGTKVVQEAFKLEVVLALKRAIDAEDEGRQTLTSASVTRFLTTEEASDVRMKGDRRALRVYERQTQ